MSTSITEQSEWARVSKELEAENLKLASYDSTLLDLLGNVIGKRLLDYGCGPGVLASALQRGGADIRAYDISEEMRKLCGNKIGHERVYANVDAIPKESFEGVICNLVLCIVNEEEVRRISCNIKDVLQQEGRAYIGFCNPLIFNVPESRLDLRDKSEHSYEQNHLYWKTKKEGGYRIVEEHRPIKWYEQVFTENGLVVLNKHFTSEYELKGRKIQDFIIFELGKK
ncbi:class I SAM-dependent methyltransferase [Candidatus Woesearchaeota archaeon]|nr:class I SAM-dependent methyltransferase [Candidatus Woesearchaeota archaeon]